MAPIWSWVGLSVSSLAHLSQKGASTWDQNPFIGFFCSGQTWQVTTKKTLSTLCLGGHFGVIAVLLPSWVTDLGDKKNKKQKTTDLAPSFGGCEQLQLRGGMRKSGSLSVRCIQYPSRAIGLSSNASLHLKDFAFLFFRAFQSPRIRCGTQSSIFLLRNHRTRDHHVSV